MQPAIADRMTGLERRQAERLDKLGNDRRAAISAARSEPEGGRGDGIRTVRRRRTVGGGRGGHTAAAWAGAGKMSGRRRARDIAPLVALSMPTASSAEHRPWRFACQIAFCENPASLPSLASDPAIRIAASIRALMVELYDLLMNGI